MAAKQLDIHPAALEELTSAIQWYFQRSESAAQRFVDEIEEALELVMKAPTRWPNYEGVSRRYILQRFPFAVVYRETRHGVQILAIAHGHRRPGYWRDRL